MEVRIGRVTHYYNRIGVAVLELSGELAVGDEIHILGYTTDFTQHVRSLEIEHQKVEVAGAGAEVAMKVAGRVRDGDEIFIVSESQA
jgi:putative protease